MMPSKWFLFALFFFERISFSKPHETAIPFSGYFTVPVFNEIHFCSGRICKCTHFEKKREQRKEMYAYKYRHKRLWSLH